MARQHRIEPPLRALRQAVRPALLRHLRGVALGHCPCRGRVEDQRTLARDQPFVVGLASSQAGTSGGRYCISACRSRAPATASVLTVILPLASIRSAPKALEHAADPQFACRCRDAHRHAEGEAGLVHLLGRRQERSQVHLVTAAVRLLAGRIHRLHVDAGMLLQQIEAAAAPTSTERAARHGTATQCALPLAEVFDRRPRFTLPLLGNASRLMTSSTISRESLYCCGSQFVNSMMSWPDLAWFFGGQRQDQLVALAGDVVDLDVDLLLLGPFLDDARFAPRWRRAPSDPTGRWSGCRRRGPCAHRVPRSCRQRQRWTPPRIGGASSVSSLPFLPSLPGQQDPARREAVTALRMPTGAAALSRQFCTQRRMHANEMLATYCGRRPQLLLGAYSSFVVNGAALL